jgi:predicted ATPase
MKLTAFRIHRYKSILDSGWIDVSPLTVLVGKNESGKTTVLKALHKFNPFDPEPYVLDREWPRSQRKGRSENQVACSTRFALSAEESEEILTLTEGKSLLTELTVTRDYKGRLEVVFPEEVFAGKLHPNAVDALCEALPAPAEPVGDAYREQVKRCHGEARRLATEGRFTQLATLSGAHLGALNAASNPWNPPPSDENELAYLKVYAASLEEIRSAIATLPPVQAAVHEYVVLHLPTFIFMDEYRAFRGSASLKEVLQRKQSGPLTGEDRTLEMILELSGLNLESEVKKAEKEDREQRQYDMDDAAVALTKVIEGRWKQVKYEVKFAADGNQFFTFVKDDKDQALIKLEERSKGFQWFFSFDLMLMYESKGQFKDCVILLDEPGLYLHPDAQRDLLKRLEEYAGANTLIYATHLPFMVGLENPQRIRILNETKEGTVVTADLTGCQPEAKFTLDAALGIAASSSFLLAPRNLVVEGESACALLSELSSLFIRSGLEGLPDDVAVIPAADAAQAAYIATLMVGRGLEVVVLLAGSVRDSLVDRWLGRYNSSVAAEALTLGAFGMEEIFPEDFYLEMVKRIYKKQLSAQNMKRLDLRGDDPVQRRVERALGDAGVIFQPRLVANQIRASLIRMKTADELPPETKVKAGKALKDAAALFGKEKQFWSQSA